MNIFAKQFIYKQYTQNSGYKHVHVAKHARLSCHSKCQTRYEISS